MACTQSGHVRQQEPSRLLLSSFYKEISCPNKHGGTSQCWVPTYEIFHKLQNSVGFFAKELPGISYSTEKLRTVTCIHLHNCKATNEICSRTCYLGRRSWILFAVMLRFFTRLNLKMYIRKCIYSSQNANTIGQFLRKEEHPLFACSLAKIPQTSPFYTL